MKRNQEIWKLHSEHVLICIIMIVLVLSQFQIQSNMTDNFDLNLNSSSEEVIWDSTHTVFSPNDQVFLSDLFFEEDWMYDFSLEVITPHQCEINMSLTDPEGYHYLIFQGIIDQELKEIQFGVVIDGDYNISLEVVTEFTLNLHVKIERTVSFMDLFDPDSDILTFNSFRFSEIEPLRELPILLDPNSSYTFNFALVSPLMNILPILNTFIDDPDENQFIIYQDLVLSEFYLTFSFQTINYGIHKLQVLINALETCLNLIVVVMLDSPDPPINNNPHSQNTLYIPIEIQVVSMGVLIFAIVLAIIMKKSSRNEVMY